MPRIAPNAQTAALKRTNSNHRIYFQPTGLVGYQSLGNMVSVTPDLKKAVTVTENNDPTERAIVQGQEVVSTIGWAWDFETNEFPDVIMRLIQCSAAPANAAQSLNASNTATFSSAVPGYTYDLGAYNVSAVVVTVSAATKVEGTDYVVDYAAGMLTILASGSIAAAASVGVAFANPALNFGSLATPQTQLTGAFKIAEFDPISSTNRSITVGTGSVYIKSGPTKADGKTAQMVTGRITFDGRPSLVYER